MPSCGANIEVNKNLEKTICQYCGTTVLIKDAIQKYKIELTGSVQVDGLKSDKKKFEEVEKYFKLKEYGNAKRTLDQIIANDEFNIEANCKWIYAVIKYFDITEETFDKVDILAENREMWEYVRYIITRFERISVIDEDNERDIYLKDLYNLLDVMRKYMQEEDETKAKREELAKNLSDAIEKNFKYYSGSIFASISYSDSNYSDEIKNLRKTFSILQDSFNNDDIKPTISYRTPNARNSDYYYFMFEIDMYRYGFFLRYKEEISRYGSNDSMNPVTYWKYYKINKEISSMDDLEKYVNECISKLNVRKKRGLFGLFR